MAKKLKTKSELLTSFKKSNKERREAIANNAGFSTTDEYLKHLETQIANEVIVIDAKEVTPVIVHNVNIVDCSYSMGTGIKSKMQMALNGVQSELDELKKDKSGATFITTFVPFSESVKTVYFREALSKVKITKSVSQGNTALYDAIVKTINKVLATKEEGEKTVIKIFTDGQDNTSTNNSSDAMYAIKRAEDQDITITFSGTASDVQRVQRDLSIRKSNTLAHDNTPKGVKMAFETSTSATRSYASKSVRGEATLDGFYKQSGTL